VHLGEAVVVFRFVLHARHILDAIDVHRLDSALPAAVLVDELVEQYAAQPRLEVGARLKLGELAKPADLRFLHQVFRIGAIAREVVCLGKHLLHQRQGFAFEALP
jgi:hypothetical protein